MFTYSGTTYLLKKSDLTWEGGEVISLFQLTTTSFSDWEDKLPLYINLLWTKNIATNVIIAMSCELWHALSYFIIILLVLRRDVLSHYQRVKLYNIFIVSSNVVLITILFSKHISWSNFNFYAGNKFSSKKFTFCIYHVNRVTMVDDSIDLKFIITAIINIIKILIIKREIIIRLTMWRAEWRAPKQSLLQGYNLG